MMPALANSITATDASATIMACRNRWLLRPGVDPRLESLSAE